MSLIRTLMAKGGMNFAHLGGVKAGPSRSAESDEDDDDKDDKSDKDAKADDDEPPKKDDQDDDGKESKAEGDDKDDGDKKDDKPPKDAKGSKADAEDKDAEDDDEEEMRGKSAEASARRREQARCAAIFGSKAAGRNPVLAANLAFNTRMTRKEALAVLESTPAPQQASAGSASRAAGNPRVDPPGAPEQDANANLMSSWDAARARNKRQGG